MPPEPRWWPEARLSVRIAGDDRRRLPRDIGQVAPRLDEPCRIERDLVDPDLVVQVAPGAAPGAADDADRPAHADVLAFLHQHGLEVAVARDHPHAVVDLDEVAIGSGVAGLDHPARGGRHDLGAARRAEIEAGMECRPALERIVPPAEA